MSALEEQQSDQMVAAVKVAIIKIKSDIKFDEVTASSQLFGGDSNDVGEVVGLDSLDMLELVISLQEEYEVDLLEHLDVEAVQTVGSLASVLSALVSR